ncbi:MAG: c-type cytochrome biogenesis protein CcmI [Acidobacteria bacterium 13_1_40CM_3_55_6]|nr:MAG: c-type cytochrome biogenesis protein CcmI [Acidobacteria bacterium 13_1_40CM_3_55_6]
MLTFGIIAALFVLLIFWFVLPPLLQKSEAKKTDANASANVIIYQDQLKELEADLKTGLIGEDQYQPEKESIERRLLEDVKSKAPLTGRVPSTRTSVIVYTLSVFIPVGAVAFYLLVGNPKALSSAPAATGPPSAAQPERQMSPQQIAANVDKLAERLKQNPNDAQGWLMLARSYIMLERYAEAAKAYERATALNANDADLWADYAEALALSNGQNLAGKPTEAINRALQVDPSNQKALDLAGSAAFQSGDYQKAISYWQQLLKQLPAGSEELRTISAQIAKAKELAGGKGSR